MCVCLYLGAYMFELYVRKSGMPCAWLAQLVRSLTANQEVPGSSPGLVEG